MSTLAPARVRKLTQIALGLAVFTVIYNLAEGVLSVWAGAHSGLATMIGFGTDSFIESLVAILVAIRLWGRLRESDANERAEWWTLRAVAISFLILAAYLVYEGVTGLLEGAEPNFSPLGLGVLIASAIIMPALWWAKVQVGRQLDDGLILADAAETKICLLMTAASLIGVLLLHVTGWGGFDALASFAIAAIAIAEAREAWEGELEED